MHAYVMQVDARHLKNKYPKQATTNSDEKG